MTIEKLKALQIEPRLKRRCGGSFRLVILGIVGTLSIAAFVARPWEHESQRAIRAGPVTAAASNEMPDAGTAKTKLAAIDSTGGTESAELTVSGYIINAARIQLSPRFLGVVEWIGVKKGDPVHKGEVLARLDDREYKAKLVQAEGVLASAKVAVEKAELAYKRAQALTSGNVATQESEDAARLELENARATLQQARGSRDEAQTYLDWCTIRSPIDGVVVEKLVNPDELVMPQSFGGAGGPSTALLAVANPRDLQVEIDVNESDLSKIAIDQKCRVSPEAYPDRVYKGHVAEIAPQANRAKGTLQIKVQIEEPDRYLTPELSAKIEFLRSAGESLARSRQSGRSSLGRGGRAGFSPHF
jgi:RND family efflux transporter MFP subunit